MDSTYEPPKADVAAGHETFDPPLFSAKGRVGRLRYLAHTGWIQLLLYVVAALAATALGGSEDSSNGLLGLAVLAGLVAKIIFAIKRSHDFNGSGWWSILSIVPLVSLVFWFIPGTKGVNRFGPPPSRNTALIVLGGLLIPFIFVLGILAAIALPAYQDYTQRAQVGEAFAMVAPAKRVIAEATQQSGDWPDAATLAQLNLGDEVVGAYASFSVEPGTGVIYVTMREDTTGPDIAGGSIIFSPEITDTFRFRCESPNLSAKFLPRSCDGQ